MVKILQIQTTQGSTIKQLNECLAGFLTDVNITFYPKIINLPQSDSETEDTEKIKIGGIIIKEINKQSSVLVHSKLFADKFEIYNYNYHLDKIVIGINLGYLLKCLKCMNNFDIMTWEMDDENMNELVIIFETKTTEKKEKKVFRLNLMDLDQDELDIDPVDFSYLISMPSQDFQKYCKDMASATDKMEIICSKDKLILKGKGDLGSVEFETGESIGGLQIQITDEDCEIVQGFYDLKYLLIFTKCTNLSNTVSLYLKNDYPLVMEYVVAALGKIKLVLSPSKSN